jgi:glycosyltransferase involved in cell wall biosynthesis
MRILILNQWLEPEPTLKGLQFARELAARGHEVEIVTGFPNYPGGNIYPGYRLHAWQRERFENISVLRVALYPSHDKSAFRRLLNYGSFAVSACMGGLLGVKRPDVIYVYHPPATVGIPAVILSCLLRVPFVYDIQDLWPDTVVLSGMMTNRVLGWLLGKWCAFIYRRAGHIVVQSPGFKNILVGRGVPSRKIDVIYNWCDETVMRPAMADADLASELGLSGHFNVMFAGTMGTGQALDSVLEAADICSVRSPDVQFVFIGGGVERDRLQRKAQDMDLKNVRFLPPRPMSEMAAVLGLADVLLVHLKNDPLFRITVPSKTQAYMASGKPILMAVGGDARDLVIQSGGGLSCESENAEDMSGAVTRFAGMSPEERRQMGEAGRRYYFERMSLKAGVSNFERVFAEIGGPADRRSGIFRHSSAHGFRT